MNEKKSISQAILTIVAIFTLFLIIYPLFMLVFGSFKHKMQLLENPWFFTFPLHFDNYVLASKDILRPLFNSFIVAGLGIAMTLCFAALAAYAIAYARMPGKNFFYFYIVSLMMVPGYVILIPQFLVVRDLHMYDTIIGQVLPPVANNVAMGFMLMVTYFRGLPHDVLEAAKVDGCSNITLFKSIILPLSKPILATVSITTGLNLWNNYLWPMMMTTSKKVMPVVVAISKVAPTPTQGNGPVFAAYVIASLPVLVLFALASKQFVAGLAAGAVKG